MILYSNSISKFNMDIYDIPDILNKKMKEKLYHSSGKSEISSWKNSLEYFNCILKKTDIPSNCTITLEYNLPISNQRIDLIITGYDNNKKPIVIIFELKQWEAVSLVKNSSYLIETFVNGSIKEVTHPGYQVYSYAETFKDYNIYIQKNNLNIKKCVLLHNYNLKENDTLLAEQFGDFNRDIMYFGKNNESSLVKFLNDNLKYGDDCIIINEIDNSKLLPSKKLQEKISQLITENNVFKLMGDQIFVYDKIISKDNNLKKKVIIVSGCPGTGKTVIAINLLNYFLNKSKLCQYVSRNTAPRVVYSYKLKGSLKKSSIDNLFKSSGSYTDTPQNYFDYLIVDEAHCLTEKSGLFNNYGENQIKEIINASKTSIFFIDERQRVHYNDIGSVENIKKMAKSFSATIDEYILTEQFRCNNSDRYLSFVEYLLGIKNHYEYDSFDYDIQVVDNPTEMLNIIKNKNNDSEARILAGYCWNWNKKEINNSDYHDIIIDDFSMSWNLGIGQTFAIDDSINEAGCIHSVQGLEFDYVGVIIGNDLEYKNGCVMSNFNNHGSADPSFKGAKKALKENYENTSKLIDELIKNAYRVLLTRGIKGCYVYCVDKDLNNLFKERIKSIKNRFN